MKRKGLMISLTITVIAAICLTLIPITASATQTEYFTVVNTDLGISGPYGEVTWDVAGGTASFNVDAYEALLNPGGGTNFGIQKFGFNTNLTILESQFILPTGWNVGFVENISGFGLFDITTDTTGSYRQDALEFSINGLGAAGDANFYIPNSLDRHFVMHVAGWSPELNGEDSAWFSDDGGTSVPDASVMLLLGSSLMGLAVFSRKSKRS